MTRAGVSPEVLFQEEQRLRNPYFWTFLFLMTSVVAGTVIWVIERQVVSGTPVGGRPMPLPTLLGLGGTVVLLDVGIFLFLAMLRLRVEVTELGLFLQLWPLHQRVRKIDLEGVSEVHAIACSPFAEYGGYGIRRRSKATAYILEGSDGVRLDFPNGCHIFLGSRRAEALAGALRRYLGMR